MAPLDISKSFLNFVRAEDQIGGYCPHCQELFRLSEIELFYIPDRKRDFLTELRKKERELKEQEDKIREDARKRSRSVIMGQLFEQVRPFLPGFRYEPGDLRSIWKPIDYVCFNGLSLKGQVDRITFIEVKSGQAHLTQAERSVQKAVEDGNVGFETVQLKPESLVPEIAA